MEQFEQEHQLSRLIDVDVFDENALPISSGKRKSVFFVQILLYRV